MSINEKKESVKTVQEKPQRSCVCCREARDKTGLLRFVMSPGGEVLPDIDPRLPGRGAYVCNSSSCLQKAINQRLFSRSFKAQTSTMESGAMVELVSRLMREKILGYLGMANRAGKIVSGGSMVADAIRDKIKPGLVLVATDVSADIASKIIYLADKHGVRFETVLTKDDFGAILGKAPRSAVAIRQGGFVDRLASEIERYRNFLGEV